MITVIKALIDLLFPPRCLVCRRLDENLFCSSCLGQIKFSPRATNGYYSLTEYKGIIQKAIKRLKFRKKKVLAKPLGKLMVDYLEKLNLKPDIIIPVPLHRQRLQERGFNQMVLIGKVISEYTGTPILGDVLVRQRHTRPQFSLKKEERQKNVAGAFQVLEPEKVKGRTILLIDDILTTGATVGECCAVLKNNGAKEIKVLTLTVA